ncbi:hypothetical protein PILCRDRAFT_755786 [Piloderma croceum F 1598]|uniref:Uncharacterized protein n=1 Tax=Piloderma croceum (strain F 1598) TaxID=765440 RepID=A0A0C3ETF9_PILCF|nr:hypothetical protein PILCRDRAFT_755786 [Piloderma croceum F 1598]
MLPTQKRTPPLFVSQNGARVAQLSSFQLQVPLPGVPLDRRPPPSQSCILPSKTHASYTKRMPPLFGSQNRARVAQFSSFWLQVPLPGVPFDRRPPPSQSHISRPKHMPPTPKRTHPLFVSQNQAHVAWFLGFRLQVTLPGVPLDREPPPLSTLHFPVPNTCFL